jgi:flagellar hook-basal body complex protein FliE
MTTATKETATAKESKWTWRGLVDRLATKRTKAIGDYAELVERLAGGEEMPDATVEAALNKVGKSVYDLQADVATKAERLAWGAEIERLQTVVADMEAAEAEDAAIIAAHNAAVEKMLVDLGKKRQPLIDRKVAGATASGQIDGLRSKLASTCPEHLGEQQQAIQAEIREAIATLTYHENYLNEMRPQLRKIIETGQPSANGVTPEGAEKLLVQLTEKWDGLAGQVEALQQQMADIEAAKVMP